jgi:uncharacterized protein (DUF2237 family)
LTEHFAKIFQKKNNVDLKKDPRAFQKLKSEVEKWQMTAAYWQEKYENRFAGNVMKVITEEPESRKIGF